MKKRLLMVTTRNIPSVASNGRERTMHYIRNSLDADTDLRELQLRSMFEQRSATSVMCASLRFCAVS